ncbi:MAG TPA: cytochrome c-type biogenesis protein CcmH [Candidatus Sulfomarinibacteraceae bacterium]|nr:cytochrome c-type biogenesis protein CcmH [Candidatus Sulfomarinibacteraceae bacterium]
MVVAILFELYKGVRARMKRGENPLLALAHLMGRNRRRYGGYVIHLVVATLNPRRDYLVVQRQPMTIPDVYTTVVEDIYVLLIGWDEEQVMAYFVERYGERVLAEPQRSGFTSLVWILPVVGLLLGLGIVVQALRTWHGHRQRELAADRADAAEPVEPTGYGAQLLALPDLEFDHELGLIADDDYARLHEQLMVQAAAALENARREKEESVSARIEAAISARRQHSQAGRSRTRFCPQCGRAVDAGDRFCTACGASPT